MTRPLVDFTASHGTSVKERARVIVCGMHLVYRYLEDFDKVNVCQHILNISRFTRANDALGYRRHSIGPASLLNSAASANRVEKVFMKPFRK